VVPAGFAMILLGHIFYSYDYEKPALWIALFGTLSRNLWGILAGIFIIGLTNGLGRKIDFQWDGLVSNPWLF
jgi:hypothetical protein